MPPPELLRVRRASPGATGGVIIVVSRKEAPRAVTRNRIRRRVHAALREIGAQSARPIILIVFKAAADAPFEELVETLRRSLPSHS